jgi:hypothetical protein
MRSALLLTESIGARESIGDAVERYHRCADALATQQQQPNDIEARDLWHAAGWVANLWRWCDERE